MRVLIIFCLVVFAAGCTKTITVIPTDKDGNEIKEARIVVDGTPTGQGQTAVQISNPVSVTVDGRPQYFSESFTVGAQSPNPLRVSLREDEIYALTIADTNKVINQWLTLSISESAAENAGWWTVVVNAIATQDFEMEMMDQKSGFVRTAWKERKFGERGLRRRFVGNVVSADPLQWRVKYQVETTNDGQNWKEFDRGVKEELDAIEEIRGRTQGN